MTSRKWNQHLQRGSHSNYPAKEDPNLHFVQSRAWMAILHAIGRRGACFCVRSVQSPQPYVMYHYIKGVNNFKSRRQKYKVEDDHH